jgi:hypothetical protein
MISEGVFLEERKVSFPASPMHRSQLGIMCMEIGTYG